MKMKTQEGYLIRYPIVKPGKATGWNTHLYSYLPAAQARARMKKGTVVAVKILPVAPDEEEYI